MPQPHLASWSGWTAERVLHNESGFEALERVRSSDAEPFARRAAWRLLMAWQAESTREALASAARDIDVWLRDWTIREGSAADRSVQIQIVGAMRTDPVGRLRARSLTLGLPLGAIDNASLAAALADRSSAARSVAQQHLAAADVDLVALAEAAGCELVPDWDPCGAWDRLPRWPALDCLSSLGARKI